MSMRTIGWMLVATVALAGCDSSVAPSDGGASDAGGDAGEPTVDAGPLDGGSIETDAGPTSDGGAGATVRWVTETEPLTIDGDIGLDFGFEYEVTVDDPFAYQLGMERCMQLAGMAETCSSDSLGMAASGSRFLRTGIDPSQYAVGENRYTFRVFLSDDAGTVAEDTLELDVTVTACSMCVGSPGAEP
jgi:hypothetical protein